ncbi:MAG: hypothetical protein ACMXYL_03705 [Candidatus Woesearchaeota archaeon]
MGDNQGLEKTLVDLAKESIVLHEGNERKSGKMFAMSLFYGLGSISTAKKPSSYDEMLAAYDVYDSALSKLRNRDNPSTVSRNLRQEIGDLRQYASSTNNSELFRELYNSITNEPVPGNSMMLLGYEMASQIIRQGTVKDSKRKDKFLREHSQLLQYLKERK